MSPQRVTDAAHISPYITYPVSHNPHLTPFPLDSAGRNNQQTKSSSPKKGKTRPRQERTERTDEEPRFNIGPRSLRTHATARGGRRPGRSGRRERDGSQYNDGISDDIPDYPPPSFLEAISSPPISECPSSPTATTSSGLPLPLPLPLEQATREASVSQPLSDSPGRSTFIPTNSFDSADEVVPTAFPTMEPPVDTESDDSLQMVEVERPSIGEDVLGLSLEERIKRDWIRRRGVEFPSPERTAFQLRDQSRIDVSQRGRAKSRTGGLFERAVESPVEDAQPICPPPVTPKRRHLSLSPLRTLFPSRPVVQDRALSAHPVPETSPYSSGHSSTSFFKSTTSLRLPVSTPSFLKSPATPTSTTSTTSRTDNFMSRKFLPSKKEKAKTTANLELLDTWEVVESEEPIPSLMSAVESLTDMTSGLSPTRSQSFTYGSPTMGSPNSLSSSANSPASPDLDRPQKVAEVAKPHFFSLKDRRSATISGLGRSTKRLSPSPLNLAAQSPTQERPLIQAAIPEVASANALPRSKSALATQTQPIVKKRQQVLNASPLGSDSWKPDDDVVHPDAIYQQALAVPLPSTPIESAHPLQPPKSPLSARLDPKVKSRLTPIVTQRVPSPPLERRQPASPRSPTLDSRHTDTAQRPSDDVPSPSSDDTLSMRHHYPGRPLPRPPGKSRKMIDSTYGPAEGTVEALAGGSHCPEGLLIDLDDDLPSAISDSSNNTPLATEATSSALSSSPSLVEFPAPSPIEADAGTTPSSVRYSNFGDLDLFVSHMNEEQVKSGSDYSSFFSSILSVGSPTSTILNSKVSTAVPSTPSSSLGSLLAEPKKYADSIWARRPVSLGGRSSARSTRSSKASVTHSDADGEDETYL